MFLLFTSLEQVNASWVAFKLYLSKSIQIVNLNLKSCQKIRKKYPLTSDGDLHMTNYFKL